jgi:membrane protease YdiL (CAAX protease family)
MTRLRRLATTTSTTAVIARMGLLIAAWGAVWVITPVAALGAPWSSFAWWTAMKGLVWFALAAVLFRPESRRTWLGTYRGRGLTVLLIAVAWPVLDTAATRIGLKAPTPTPSLSSLLAGWNATLNVLVMAPILEELLFRGLFWSKLEATKLRGAHVWLLSAGAFAALHLPGWIAMRGASPSLFGDLGMVFLVGLFTGLGRWLSGSVWPAAFLHLVNNVTSMGVFSG